MGAIIWKVYNIRDLYDTFETPTKAPISNKDIIYLDLVAPMKTDPPLTISSSTTRKGKKRNMWHVTHDMWHGTCDIGHVTCDTWGGEHSLKVSGQEDFEEKDELISY